jgi:type IV pilus assembly protein PilE
VGELGLDISKITPLYDVTLTGVGAAASFQIGYVATATPVAGSKQALDVTCKTLVVTLTGATPVYTATGDPTNSGTNSATNDQCWPR